MSTKAQPDNASFADRISFVDVMRGIAVVAMIWMHTADGWLDRSYRQSAAWPRIVTFGGLAAPLFFTLAGVGLGLAWAGTKEADLPRRLRSQVLRGVQLIVLGYALRVQMWMIDAGGYRKIVHWLIAAGLIAGYVILHQALQPKATHRAAKLTLALACVIACLSAVGASDPARLPGLLRVDVLQGIGASTVIVCALASLVPLLTRTPSALLVLAIASAFATATVRTWLPGPLPAPIAGYLAAWPTAPGVPSTTLFPVLPWMAYVFAGAAFAMAWKRAPDRGSRQLFVASAVGVAIAFASSEVQPWIHVLHQALPSAVHLTRVIYRLALAAVLITPALLIAPTVLGKMLRELGTASLWIYWIHLELAFGSLARPISHTLTTVPWLVGFVVLSALMLAIAIAINTQVGVERLRALIIRWRSPSRA